MTEHRILVLDDNPEESPLSTSDIAVVVHPLELTESQLVHADLVLVDYLLENWTSPQGRHPPLRDGDVPLVWRLSDGLALAGVIQAHHRRMEREKTRKAPAAVALLSGQLELLSPGFNNQEHVVALTYGLDWAFDKTPESTLPDLSERVKSLSDAVRALPNAWPNSEKEIHDLIRNLLGLQDVGWAPVAWSDIENSHPPVHELARWTDGLTVMRWLLQRILPYPCFLLDIRYLSARLGITVEWARNHMNESLRDLLKPAQYRGVLAEFLGPRWWAAGLDNLIWDLEQQQIEIADWLRDRVGAEPTRSPPNPVVCIGEDYRARDELASTSDCVRLQLDDWPAYSHDAWARVDEVLAVPALHAQVIVADRDKLHT